MALNKTMLFGPIGRQVGIPWPEGGMGIDNNLYTESTDLLSGEQAIWRAPLTYKTYSMSWSGGSDALQPIIDVHAGLYGQGPYYITDPIAAVQGNNLLPAKWASPFMLQHVANGWGNPVVSAQANTPEQQQIVFTGQNGESEEAPFSIVVPCVPGQPLYLAAWGGHTGLSGLRVYRYFKSSASWVLRNPVHYPSLTNDAPATLVSQTQADAGDIVAVKIVPYAPVGTVLTLQHIDLAVNDYRTYTPHQFGFAPGLYPDQTLYPGMVLYPESGAGAPVGVGSMFRSGKGTGPVQFTGNVGGSLNSAVIDRIGLSMDICEVSRDRNN